MLRIFRILIFISACFRERSGTKKAFRGKYPPRSCPLCGGNNCPWENGFPTPLTLEMRCRLTRCTCISQNLAFAPRTEYCVSNPRF